MKRLLLLLCLVGAAVYLLAPLKAVPVRNETVIAQARVDSDQRADKSLRTSWGSTLQSLKQQPRKSAATDETRTYRQAAAYGERPYQGDADPQQRGIVDMTSSIGDAPTTTTSASDPEAERWARVTLAATLYSQPSVSSPIAGYSSPGKEVRIHEYKKGWFRVQDPGTQETGWVFYKSLEYIHGPKASPTQVAATAEPAAERPTAKPPAKVVSRASHNSTPTAKPAIQASRDHKVVAQRDFRSAARVAQRKVAETGKRRRGFGLFKRRQERRAWSLGPAR